MSSKATKECSSTVLNCFTAHALLLTPLCRALCTAGIIIYYLRAWHPWGEHKKYELMYEKRMCGTEQGRIQDFYEGK